ncbi:MAG: fucose isomerase [Defluviitaleaceae bacterium]|nr:fucose isomerase [Defluviitaleaceae bacterium]MCL2274543.1 fucose isomerase [Defluviitaleaceae bacterium]
MMNAPEVKLGIVAVSRDCFPMTLSERRRKAVVEALNAKKITVTEISTIVENEKHAMKALDELRAAGCNALAVYLGNFGPEGPETLLAQKFCGPTMFVAAAEETGNDLINSRGDAYCGMLNASYNLGLRGVTAYIPEYPVGTADEAAAMISEFLPIAKVKIGLSKLKIFAFGPRPFDFMACNAPIAPLFKLGVEIQENSELDLFAAFNKRKDDPRVEKVAAEMAAELGNGNKHSGVLTRLAQLEITLLDWAEEHKGASEYFVFANKCWPAFQTQFGMVPCYVNSRLTARGIPVSCETDIYGALSEYILYLVTETAPTLLDINNTVPQDMYDANKAKLAGYKPNDLFMGFHCGNTPIQHLKEDAEMKHQLIMKRALEPDGEPDITRGTLEGTIKAADITLFRLQSTADCVLRSYIAQGETLDIDHKSFGGIGIIGVNEMARFYRHVLVAKRYPHHAGLGFGHVGKALYSAMKFLGVCDVAYNQPASLPYCGENPFR